VADGPDGLNVRGENPTYLLVHGAWHSGQCWERVVPLLAAAGHRVVAPSLTGYGDKARLLSREVGLDTHVDDIVGLIIEEDLTEVVLVGHSYAGLVISSAANQVPERIAGLVYLDAMVPEDGESAVDIQPVTQVLIDRAAKGEGLTGMMVELIEWTTVTAVFASLLWARLSRGGNRTLSAEILAPPQELQTPSVP